MTPVKVEIRHTSPEFPSYRAARVRSLFNAEGPPNFSVDAELPIEDRPWKIGVVVGPSGSGKTSIGARIWPDVAIHDPRAGWVDGHPVIDDIPGDFNEATAALGAVGLGDVPAWLREFRVLSNGQQFRADLARIVAGHPDRVVLDEFSSVVDRQIAQVGAGAFSKSWKRTDGQAVLLSCHYDVLDWLEPDWVFDTATREFSWNTDREGESRRWRKPRIELEVRMGGWDLWPLFKPHHYLDLPHMIGARCYVGFIAGEPVVHLAVATKNAAVRRESGPALQTVEARASRLVVMPEWQGAGVGMRFLNAVCEMQLHGEGVLDGRRMTTQFQTSHPQLAAACRRSPMWRQISGSLHGNNKGKSSASMERTRARGAAAFSGSGYGGHFRAVQGFRYYGESAVTPPVA